MGMAVEKKGHDHPRVARESRASAQDMLEEARSLAAQIEGLLTDLGRDVAESDNFRVRLARAHTLSLLDQLAEMLAPRSRSSSPSVRSVSPREDDENASTGVRPGSRAMFAR